jgi:hypothetical protein
VTPEASSSMSLSAMWCRASCVLNRDVRGIIGSPILLRQRSNPDSFLQIDVSGRDPALHGLWEGSHTSVYAAHVKIRTPWLTADDSLFTTLPIKMYFEFPFQLATFMVWIRRFILPAARSEFFFIDFTIFFL